MLLHKRTAATVLSMLSLTLAACGSGGDEGEGAVPVGDTIALTTSGKLISFNRTTPAALVGSVNLSGLPAGETLLGIDVRPADGKLYGLGSAGNLYTLDPATGRATLKSALKATAGDDAPYSGLAGTSFGVDFNPVADRLRVVSETGQNLRINVDTGDTTTDGGLPANARVTAAAYTNSFAGTSSTRLFDLDLTAGQLHLQDPPNAGTLAAGVSLGVNGATAANGFDIDARSNTGYAALTVGAETALYRINLAATADAATKIGPIANGESLRGIALAPVAAPRGLALTTDNRLLSFELSAPNTLTGSVPVTGLGAGETLVGIDFRPRDGLLYGLTTGSKLYTIDPGTGAASLRAALAADPGDATAPFTGLTGTVFSVDFNPAADRLRVISNDGLNLRIAVETVTTGGATVNAGHTTTDGPINHTGAAPSVVAAAYTNSFAGATATALYNLEQNTDRLTLQNPPNNGTLTDVGPLGVDVAGAAGFDIGGGENGLVLAALRTGSSGPFSLYGVSLTTGAAALYRNTGAAALSQIGGAGGPANLIDLAIRF